MSITDASVPEATLTSRKPIEPIDKGDYRVYGPIEMAQPRLRYLTMRLEYMSKWWQRHRDWSRHINPRMGFFEGFIPNYSLGIDYKLVLDGTPQRCLRTLAAGMQSGLSTPDQLWFLLGLPDKDLEKWSPVKEWLEACRDIQMNTFADSNVYETLHQSYGEEGLFGTSAFHVDEDYQDTLRCRAFTAGEYFLANDACGRTNAFARFEWMTVDNIVQEYGWKNCSTRIKNAYQSGQRDTYFQVYLLIEQNTTKVEGRIGYEGMKWRRTTWEADLQDDKCLRLGGYNEFPVIATCWDRVTTADVYGMGPGGYAIGDVKSSYRMKKTIWMGEEKRMDPPVMISSDVTGQVSMHPGGITYTSSKVPNAGAQPAYQVQPDLQGGTELWNMTKQDLKEWFYTDLFTTMISAPNDTQKTAAEIAARHESMLRLLGPVLERQFGKFRSLLDRSFMIHWRAGMFPPPPKEIQGMPIIPRFVSILAQAQQMIKAQAIEKGLAFVSNASATFPQAKDVIDPDEMTREALHAYGVPARVLRSPDQVEAIRKEQQQQIEQEKQQQNAMAAVQAAKTLSETNAGGKNMLEHATGLQPGQPAQGGA